ncbi:MAG: FAD-dependent oxidoreductase [Cyanobacteriota bacterium]|nr:FAD-dependent oxidoreductase [Cyanobacteriota bacterium]
MRAKRRYRFRRGWLGLALLSFLAGAMVGWLPRIAADPSSPARVAAAFPPSMVPSPLNPLPASPQIWTCQVVVVGGSLGGVAAAYHAMQGGAQTCLIEVSPWLGGQISSQGVSALDESLPMRNLQNFSPSWNRFKAWIAQQSVPLPAWIPTSQPLLVHQINSCWVGFLCFPPQVGARAAEGWLAQIASQAPGSRWSVSTAFKGAERDASGQQITAIYAVQRLARDPDYLPQGRLSRELIAWYSWSPDPYFEKIPIRLQPPAGESLIVIDATDTGEVVAWSQVPYRLGSESAATTGEPNAAPQDNPECTQAFTYPFVLAIHDDQGVSQAKLASLQPGLSRAEHRRDFDLEGFPLLAGKSFFHYRRSLSLTQNDPFVGIPARGDMTLVNWNRGNDWGVMNPSLIMTATQLSQTRQLTNWLGGLQLNALKDGEDHALLFAEWLMETYAQPDWPLALLTGKDPGGMGTVSGLSMTPYIREGRRILGRAAYGQPAFFLQEQDIRRGTSGGRDFSATAVALVHYAIDIHGCRYRNWEPSQSASSAPVSELAVKPILIPLESLIPQGIDNLLIGGKSLAVSHIVNAATRVHYGEWSIGAAAGGTAAWLLQQAPTTPPLSAAGIPSRGKMADLQAYLQSQGLRWTW